MVPDRINDECTLGMSGRLLSGDDGGLTGDEGKSSSEASSLGKDKLLISLRFPKRSDNAERGEGWGL